MSFIDGSRGRLFCIHALPKHPRNHTVLLVPAFAEEMNSCRWFFTLIRRQLCQQGFSVIQPDLYGTGDSQGLFQEASWAIWVEDLGNLINSLLSNGKNKLSVLSIRSGCLLAQDILRSSISSLDENVVENLIYLQPELTGFNVLNKLLRLKVASNRLAGNTIDTCDSLWQHFEEQTDVLAMGYQIGHKLALQMRDSKLIPEEPIGAKHSVWIELMPDEGTEVAGTFWQFHEIASKPFWQMHDIEPEQSTVEAIAALVNA